jgi:hypothetical protein
MSDVERILQNTPGSISQQWYEAGAVVDPGTVTVGITAADGTEVVAAGTGTTGAGTNPRIYNLTTTHTALLDSLTVTWTSSAKGTLVSYLEVVGGFVFSLAELTAVKPQYATWTTAQMSDMRTTVETAFEEEYGTALVPRYKRQTITTSVAPDLLQLNPVVRAIRDATVDGTALTAPQLAELTWSPGGSVYGYPWTGAYSNIVVGYEYGLPHPPPRIKQGLLRLAKQWLTNGPIDDRAAVYNIAEGGTYSMVVPGRNGSTFGMPELDAIINQSPYRIGVA